MLSLIPHYVTNKGRRHGARHGKTEAQKQYHIAFNAQKRCRKRVDGQEEHYEGIHDRFLRDPVCRDSQLKIGWTEQKSIEMDVGTGGSLLLPIVWGVRDIGKMGLSHDCADATSIRLSSRSHNQEPSPPRISQRTCRTFSFSLVSKRDPSFSRCSWWNWNVQKLLELTSSILFFLDLLQ